MLLKRHKTREAGSEAHNDACAKRLYIKKEKYKNWTNSKIIHETEHCHCKIFRDISFNKLWNNLIKTIETYKIYKVNDLQFRSYMLWKTFYLKCSWKIFFFFLIYIFISDQFLLKLSELIDFTKHYAQHFTYNKFFFFVRVISIKKCLKAI